MAKTTRTILYNGLNNSLLFIEKYWKHILAVTLILAFLFSIKECNGYKKAVASKSDFKTVELFNDAGYTSEIKKWIDAYNVEHLRAENLVVNNETIKVAFDSVAKLLKLKSAGITSISKTGTAIQLKVKPQVDTVLVAVECPTDNVDDSSYAKDLTYVPQIQQIHWSDNWISVSATPDEINVTGSDTLKRYDYWQRKHWWSKKIWYTDFTNSNPHISVTGYKGIMAKDSKSKWSVGIGLQLGYNITSFQKPAIQAGISLQRSLFSF